MALLTLEEFVTRTGWTVPVAVLFREVPDTEPAWAGVWDRVHHALSLQDPRRTHWCLGPPGFDRTVMLRESRQMLLLRGALRPGRPDAAGPIDLLAEPEADRWLADQARKRHQPEPMAPALRRAIADTVSDMAIDPEDLGDCWMVVADDVR